MGCNSSKATETREPSKPVAAGKTSTAEDGQFASPVPTPTQKGTVEDDAGGVEIGAYNKAAPKSQKKGGFISGIFGGGKKVSPAPVAQKKKAEEPAPAVTPSPAQARQWHSKPSVATWVQRPAVVRPIKAGARPLAAPAAVKIPARPPAVGDKIPTGCVVDVGSGQRGLAGFCEGRTVILLGTPGAFEEFASKKQIPGYLAKADELRKKGVHSVLVMAVNDPPVMLAWAKELGTQGGFVQMLADPRMEASKALGKELEDSHLGRRCKRFAMVIVDGVVKTMYDVDSSSDPAGDNLVDCVMVDKLLKEL
eukprot:TRINITY_DN23776_c0_g1_i1.p1 TRINITY_DN23776_c0_g1~~TRINITY_DN23776_c0_g1_i1.p1  ORF type:complete len:308 (-),score=78.63 TRINITY_DN23776_c0_g1_i1:446-1369(-)